LNGLRGIPALNFVAPPPILARGCQPADDFGQQVTLDRLAVMSDVAFPDAVQVDAPDVERILPERTGDVVHHGLDHHHALRTAEAAERRVRHGVGLASMGNDLDVFKIVGVIDVEHRAIVHRSGQVG
jgi:hypothetical protein